MLPETVRSPAPLNGYAGKARFRRALGSSFDHLEARGHVPGGRRRVAYLRPGPAAAGQQAYAAPDRTGPARTG